MIKMTNKETFFFKEGMVGGTRYHSLKDERLFGLIKNTEVLNSEEISGLSIDREDEEIRIWIKGKAEHFEANLQNIEKNVLSINDLFELIEDGEISPIVAYKYFRKWQGIIDNALKLIENRTRDMVEENPLLHKDFRISTRKTYDFKSSEFYNQKLEEIGLEKAKEEIKEVEKLLITATDLGKVIYDENGVAIEPVEVKFNQILSYTPKKK